MVGSVIPPACVRDPTAPRATAALLADELVVRGSVSLVSRHRDIVSGSEMDPRSIQLAEGKLRKITPPERRPLFLDRRDERCFLIEIANMLDKLPHCRHTRLLCGVMSRMARCIPDETKRLDIDPGVLVLLPAPLLVEIRKGTSALGAQEQLARQSNGRRTPEPVVVSAKRKNIGIRCVDS